MIVVSTDNLEADMTIPSQNRTCYKALAPNPMHVHSLLISEVPL